MRSHVKVMLIGDERVGKTSLMNRYVDEKFSAFYKPTIGADFLTKELVIGGENLHVQIFDTPGQERFRSFSTQFYKGSDGCALVFDVNVKESFHAMEKLIEGFLSQVKPDSPENFPFVVVGNKIDLERRAIAATDVGDLCIALGNVPYIETSVKETVNVERAFELLIGKILGTVIKENVTISEELDNKNGSKVEKNEQSLENKESIKQLKEGNITDGPSQAGECISEHNVCEKHSTVPKRVYELMSAEEFQSSKEAQWAHSLIKWPMW